MDEQRRRTRDDFLEPVRRRLMQRVHGLCSNPSCRAPTLGPHTDPGRATVLGRAAHITGAARDGPRWDPTLTRSQRRKAENGIWLCCSCHALVDQDEARYSPDLLRSWKAMAESAADSALGLQSGPKDIGETMTCPRCGRSVRYGLLVCDLCKAEVIYGLTRSERKAAVELAFMAGAFISWLLIYGLPEWIQSHLGWHVEPGWGLALVSALSVWLVLTACIAGCFLVVVYRWAKHRPPRFVWTSLE
jgi:hypothetical protein